MNLAPVRGSYLESCCGASPVHDMRPLQGQQRESMSTGGRQGQAPILEYEPLSGAIPRNLAASALKGQPVQSPGQRPGYQCINAYAL